MYTAKDTRYDEMIYNRSGRSGLKLPAISLGLWHNFGEVDDFFNMRDIILGAFDAGITHFDLANNYGPPGGEAERNFGEVLRADLRNYRDEIIISTKAGYSMWPGPYGDWGSRKYMLASLDQSLKRLDVDYVDIFYSHRPDPATPMEETMMSLDHAVRSGKALYAGISSYDAEQTRKAQRIMKQLGTPLVIHQPRYNMFDRWVEDLTTTDELSLLQVLDETGMGCIVFSPLAQGRLTDRYLDGIPKDSRVGRQLTNGAILEKDLNEQLMHTVRQLNELALSRKQTLAQMAIAWLLYKRQVTSVLVGASTLDQLLNSVGALKNQEFEDGELKSIGRILKLY